MKIEGFDWDKGNILKNEKKHGLTHDVIEEFFRGQIWVAPDPAHSQEEDRFLAIGVDSNGKPMIVAFTIRYKDETRLIRPISARYMHAKETKKYEQAFTKNEK